MIRFRFKFIKLFLVIIYFNHTLLILLLSVTFWSMPSLTAIFFDFELFLEILAFNCMSLMSYNYSIVMRCLIRLWNFWSNKKHNWISCWPWRILTYIILQIIVLSKASYNQRTNIWSIWTWLKHYSIWSFLFCAQNAVPTFTLASYYISFYLNFTFRFLFIFTLSIQFIHWLFLLWIFSSLHCIKLIFIIT